MHVFKSRAKQISETIDKCERLIRDQPASTVIQNRESLISTIKEECAQLDMPLERLNRVIQEMHELSFMSNLIPVYDYASFCLEGFKAFSQSSEIVYSPVVRLSGIEWRLKCYVFDNGDSENKYLSVFLELVQGLNHCIKYSYQIDLVKHAPDIGDAKRLSKDYESAFCTGECWGYQKFIKLEHIFSRGYYDAEHDCIKLDYRVRPQSYNIICQQLRQYINKLESKQHIWPDREEHQAATMEEKPTQSPGERLASGISQETLAESPDDVQDELDRVSRLASSETELEGAISPTRSEESIIQYADELYQRLRGMATSSLVADKWEE